MSSGSSSNNMVSKNNKDAAVDTVRQMNMIREAIPMAHRRDGPQYVAIMRRPHGNIYASKTRDMIEMVVAIGYDIESVQKKIAQIELPGVDLQFDILRLGEPSVARDTYDTRDVDTLLTVGDDSEANVVLQSREALRETRQFFSMRREQRERAMQDDTLPERVTVPLDKRIVLKRDEELTRCIVENRTAATAVFNVPTSKREQRFYGTFEQSIADELDPDAKFAQAQRVVENDKRDDVVSSKTNNNVEEESPEKQLDQVLENMTVL